MYVYGYTTWGGTQKMEFIYKKLCIYSYMFKLKSPSKYSPSDVHTYWDIFPTAQNSLNLFILMPFNVFAFLFHLFCISKMFPFEDFFHQGTKKKVSQGKIGWIGRVGYGHHAVLGQKLLNSQHSVDSSACKSPIMKWANALVFKKIRWSRMQPLTTMPAGTLMQMGS